VIRDGTMIANSPSMLHRVQQGDWAFVCMTRSDASVRIDHVAALRTIVCMMAEWSGDARMRYTRQACPDVARYIVVNSATQLEVDHIFRTLEFGSDAQVVRSDTNPLRDWFGFDDYRPGQQDKNRCLINFLASLLVMSHRIPALS